MSLEALLADLKKEYLAALPTRIIDLREQLNRADFDTLQDSFHRLKGSGKTYGVPDLSKLGELGEKICRDRRENIAAAIPLLLDLITHVGNAATAQDSFDVSQDPRFSNLQKLI